MRWQVIAILAAAHAFVLPRPKQQLRLRAEDDCATAEECSAEAEVLKLKAETMKLEAQKAELLGGAGALLFPIDWPEPFGLVMIEAMSCGTPVIAWRNGSVPEVMQDKVSGRIVDTMDDAVAAVDEVFAFDRAKVRDYFERRFTVRRMADDYVQMFEQQIARHQNSRAIDTVDVFPDALRHGSFRAAPPPALDTAA